MFVSSLCLNWWPMTTIEQFSMWFAGVWGGIVSILSPTVSSPFPKRFFTVSFPFLYRFFCIYFPFLYRFFVHRFGSVSTVSFPFLFRFLFDSFSFLFTCLTFQKHSIANLYWLRGMLLTILHHVCLQPVPQLVAHDDHSAIFHVICRSVGRYCLNFKPDHFITVSETCLYHFFTVSLPFVYRFLHRFFTVSSTGSFPVPP